MTAVLAFCWNFLKSIFGDGKLVAQVNLVFSVFLLLGFIALGLCVDSVRHAGPAMLWGLACLAVGAFIGLLFGIPRMRQRPGSPKGDTPAQGGGSAPEKVEPQESTSKYQPEINNNLIEVSDWLTKIIVGVGLIELGALPSKLRHIATPLVQCLGSDCGLAIAIGTIVYFTSAGFLAGYINARTFIAILLRRSEDELLNEVAALKKQVDQTAAKQVAQQVVSDLRNMGTAASLTTESTQSTSSSRLPSAHAPEPDQALLRLVGHYESINDKDYHTRLFKKDHAASAIAKYIITEKIPKSVLLSWTQSRPTDGLIIGLASCVLSMPEPGDLTLLLRVARQAQWLHVKYRVALAFRALCAADFGTPHEWNDALKILDAYRLHAQAWNDSSLIGLSEEASEMIRARMK